MIMNTEYIINTKAYLSWRPQFTIGGSKALLFRSYHDFLIRHKDHRFGFYTTIIKLAYSTFARHLTVKMYGVVPSCQLIHKHALIPVCYTAKVFSFHALRTPVLHSGSLNR